MVVPQKKPGGVPHRLLEVVLEIFEVLGGLGRFGRMLRAVLHGYGRSGRDLERLLDGLSRGVGRSWRGFGGQAGAQDGSEIQKLSVKVLLQEEEGFKAVFLMDFVSNTSSLGDHR